MLFHMDGKSIQSRLRTLSVLVSPLVLTLCCQAQSQLTGSAQPIVATLGDDIILPCQLEPAEDATDLTVEWSRPDLNPRFVHVWRSAQHLVGKQHKLFEGRTSLLVEKLKLGNISLKLSKVKIADRGTYRCFTPGLDRQCFVQLLVGAVSSPVINLAGIARDKEGVVLQCESSGWYPEPEVLWLDGEGKLLSAGPTETVRGPDDLYTVSSRVTVEKRHSNSFTCRVHQEDTNHTRETHTYIPDDFFNIQSSSAPIITGFAVSLAVTWIILFVLLLFFFVWKRRQKITKTKISDRDGPEEGEKNNFSENNKSEDELTEERERLMAADSVQMQVFKEEGEDNTKHHEDKLSAASDLSLVPDEDLKKKKTANEVDIPNKEANQAAPAQSFLSSWPFSSKTQAEKDAESLKEVLSADNKKLQEEKQRSEKELKKELENKKKEVDQLSADIKKLQQEKQRREEELKEEKEKEVKELGEAANKRWKEQNEELNKAKGQIKSKDAEIHQLKGQSAKRDWTREGMEKHQSELWDYNETWQKVVKEEMTKRENAEKELENLKELQTKWEKQLQEEKTKRENAEKELENLKEPKFPFKKLLRGSSKRKNAEREPEILKEPKNKVNATRCEVQEFENSQPKEQDNSQSSATAPVIVDEISKCGKYICLKNTSNEDKPLGGWQLHMQVNDRTPIMYTFEESFTLRSRKKITISVPGYGTHLNPVDLVWTELKPWSSGDKLQVSLISNTGEIQHQLSS